MKPQQTMDWCKLNTWKQKCVVVVVLAVVGPTSPQFPMPPMMMMPPAASQETAPAGPPENSDNMALAVPVPMPMPLQIAVPALSPPSFCASRPRAPACPPCPPCLCAPACTPSFFAYCSPCHQKCRCTNGKESPVPLPPVPPLPAPGPAFALPMPVPPPAIMVAIPPFPRMPTGTDSSCSSESRSSSSSSSDSSDSDKSSSCEGGGGCRRSMRRGRRKHRKRHKSRRKRIGYSRRSIRGGGSRRSMRGGGRDLIKPVLSFINNRGDVKLKHFLNENDVRTLTRDSLEERPKKYVMERSKEYTMEGAGTTEPLVVQNVRLTASEDSFKRPQIILISDYKQKPSVNGKGGLAGAGLTRQQTRGLKKGTKELVFTPPHDKTIKNLSVTFQVT